MRKGSLSLAKSCNKSLDVLRGCSRNWFQTEIQSGRQAVAGTSRGPPGPPRIDDRAILARSSHPRNRKDLRARVTIDAMPSPSTKPDAAMSMCRSCERGERRRHAHSSTEPATRGRVQSGVTYMPIPKAMPEGSSLPRADSPPAASASGSATPRRAKAFAKARALGGSAATPCCISTAMSFHTCATGAWNCSHSHPASPAQP
mmetsp:Transcript_29847/g.95479  ORF Transcript_29847/g.95479 Transcript_29847/m.95479 type:complete len:202 (-) Transcript_29847:831-1436(-)